MKLSLESRKVKTVSIAFVLVVLTVGLRRTGVELTSEEMHLVSGAIVALAMALVGGVAVEDHGRNCGASKDVLPSE